MLAYPHHPDEESVTEALETAMSLIEQDPSAIQRAIDEGHASFIRIDLAQCADAAACRYALGAPRGDVLPLLVHGARLAAAAVGARMPLSPAQFGVGLAMAAITREAQSMAKLAAAPREAFTNPNITAPELQYALVALQSALAGQRDPAQAAEALARIDASEGNVRPVHPPKLIVPIALAVARNDRAGLIAAVAGHARTYPAIYRRASQRSQPESLLDIWGLGFVALGVARGLGPAPEGNLWLPASLSGN